MPSPRFRPIPTLATIIGFTLLMGLGTWQYRRAAEKTAQENARDLSATQPPQEITSAKALHADFAYRPIRVQGTLDHTRLVTFKHRILKGHPGFWVGAPMILSDGSSLWTNLGWLPIEAHDDFTQKLRATPSKKQTYDGIWHIPSQNIKDTITRKELQKNPDLLTQSTTSWRSYDITALHNTLSTDKAPQPGVLVLKETHSGDPFPVASTSYITKPYMTSDRHMSYAAFWYTTGAALLLLFLSYSFGFIGSFGKHRKTPNT